MFMSTRNMTSRITSTTRDRIFFHTLCLLLMAWGMVAALPTHARNKIFSPQYKTLQAVVNNDWLSPPVMRLNSDDILNIGFDELSHEYHRLVYKIAHCEADWSPSDGLFESDYVEGFNGLPIEDYQNSRGTTTLYTHYRLQIPNSQCRIKMSGNYRLTIYDEDSDMEKVMEVEFRVTDSRMNVGIEVSTNTDIDNNLSHQQLRVKLNYNGLKVTNLDEQVYMVVTQNGREDNMKVNPKPTFISNGGLEWDHNRQLIFKAGNEYHKYEVLALTHPTMGIDHITWDGHAYHAYPFASEPRHNYLYDEDANGAFYIRNSDNFENDYTCDYVFVHYRLDTHGLLPVPSVFVDGWWTTDQDRDSYRMVYDEESQAYHTTLLQKQGYYSYQYLRADERGATDNLECEGNFYQTENRYQVYVYYRPIGARTWQLCGYQQKVFSIYR